VDDDVTARTSVSNTSSRVVRERAQWPSSGDVAAVCRCISEREKIEAELAAATQQAETAPVQ
jgi:hypothetical protein